MTVREYVGARYVPLFMGTWNINNTYEPLSIVEYQGNSYTSRQYVPANVSIDDERFWAATGNYNAQIEAYRAEVQQFDSRITGNANDIATINSDGWVTANRIAANAVTNAKIAENAISTPKIADGAVNEEKIRTGAISTDKIANLSVTAEKLAADSVTPAKILNNAISEEKLSSALQQKINNPIIYNTDYFKNAVSVAFGDSNMWGQMDYLTTNIYRRICNLLGCQYNNFALSGAGFEDGTSATVKTVIRQIQDENTVTANNVKLVVIMAGINDYHYGSHDVSVFQTAINNTLNAAIAKYPNAIIVVMMDGGKQLPTNTMLLFQLGLARQAASHRNCIWVPLADLCTQANLWENQNHYNDAGAIQIAQRVKAALTGGYFPPAGRRIESHTYTSEDATPSGYYGITKYAETWINPYTLVRYDKIEFMITTDFGNTNPNVVNVSSGNNIIDVPGTLTQLEANSSFADSFAVYSGSGTNINVVPMPLNLLYSEPGDYQSDPRVSVRVRFNQQISDITGHVGGFRKLLITLPS